MPQGQTVDCKHAIFIMTSNIGARVIQKRGNLGFQAAGDASREKMEEQVMSQVKQTFAPEFINRLDEIIIFDELTDDDLVRDRRPADRQTERRSSKTAHLHVTLTDEARHMADRKDLRRPQIRRPPAETCPAKIRRRRAFRSPHTGRRAGRKRGRDTL